MHRLNLGLCSHPKEFWGVESEPILIPWEKYPRTGKKILPRGGSNLRRCIKQDSEPNRLPTSYSGPSVCSDRLPVAGCLTVCLSVCSPSFSFSHSTQARPRCMSSLLTVCQSLSACVYFLCMFVSVFVFLSLYLRLYSLSLSMYVCLCLCLPISLSLSPLSLSLSLFVSAFVCLPLYLCLYSLSLSLSVCLSLSLSSCLSLSLSLSLYVCLSLSFSACLSISVCILSLRRFVSAFVCLSLSTFSPPSPTFLIVAFSARFLFPFSLQQTAQCKTPTDIQLI